jgi:2-polyprenyl-3-methyl-5-hydroxy-6-metoxy-1,4-benzoquinol methylase
MFSCKLCGADEAEFFDHKDAKSKEILSIAFCQSCSLVQQAEIPSDEALKIYYSHNYRTDYKRTYEPKLKHVFRAGNAAWKRLKFLQGSIPKSESKSLIDIGAGGGEFVYLATKSGFVASGIEPNLGYSEYARDEYGVRIDTLMLDDLRSASADVITLFHVFEHMARPLDTMRKISEVLTEGGYLLVEVPNILYTDASPHNIFFKAHLFYYSRYTLEAAAAPFFDIVSVEGGGNLRMLFRKKTKSLDAGINNNLTAVAHTKQRLQEKGWIEYLFMGGGWKKPFKKVASRIREASLPKVKAREILDLHLDQDDKKPILRGVYLQLSIVAAALGAFTAIAD